MIVENLIKITESTVRLFSEDYIFRGMGFHREPIYEGDPKDIPYKFIRLEVLEIAPANYILEIRVNTKKVGE